MKNTKKIFLSIACLVFLASCGAKTEDAKIVVDQKNETKTSTGKVEEKGNSTGILEKTKNEDVSVKMDDSHKIKMDTIKKGEVKTMKNDEVGYELTYNDKNEIDTKEQKGVDLFVVDESQNNIFAAVSVPYPEKSLKEYIDKGMEAMKKELKNLKNLKKEDVTLGGAKGYKISYEVDNLFLEQYFFEGKNKNLILLSKTLKDKANKDFDEIIKSFKIIK